MGKNMEATVWGLGVLYCGSVGIMEKKTEATF